MSNITLPASFPPAGSGGQTATAVPGTIPDPPRGLLDLASGTLLKGEVIGHDRQGHVLIRTPEGVLPVASRAQLPEGSQVTLQIRSHGAQLHISVLQVDGHSPRLRPSAPGAGAPDASAPGTGDPQPAPRPGTRPAGPPNSAPDSAPNSVTTRGPAISTAANPTPTSLPAIPDGAAGPRLPGRVTHAPPAAASLPNGARSWAPTSTGSSWSEPTPAPWPSPPTPTPRPAARSPFRFAPPQPPSAWSSPCPTAPSRHRRERQPGRPRRRRPQHPARHPGQSRSPAASATRPRPPTC